MVSVILMVFGVCCLYTFAVEGVRLIEVLGRTLKFEKTCGHILDVGFAELCNKVLLMFTCDVYYMCFTTVAFNLLILSHSSSEHSVY